MRSGVMALLVAGALLGSGGAAAQTAPGSVPAAPAPAAGPEPHAAPDITNTNPSAPVPGANSFTENQARKRLEANGFADVSDLQKDEDGIWRGRASKNGRVLSVAVDYQGNLVAR